MKRLKAPAAGDEARVLRDALRDGDLAAVNAALAAGADANAEVYDAHPLKFILGRINDKMCEYGKNKKRGAEIDGACVCVCVLVLLLYVCMNVCGGC